MSGLLALLGSGEYLPQMEAVDRGLLAAAGPDPLVACVPAAAGREGQKSVERWQRLGREHFTKLGARLADVRIVDRASADDPRWVALLEQAGLIYFSGGDPLYLHQALADTRAWAAVRAASERGAVLAGCSAGAMVLGAAAPNVRSLRFELKPVFGWLPGAVILPHFDRIDGFRPGARQAFRQRLQPGQFGLGIDEDTALVGRVGGEWEVQGARTVTLLSAGGEQVFAVGQRISLPAGSV